MRVLTDYDETRVLTDYDETRRRRSRRGYRTVADGKPPKKYVSYYCPNMDCRHSWTTVEGSGSEQSAGDAARMELGHKKQRKRGD